MIRYIITYLVSEYGGKRKGLDPDVAMRLDSLLKDAGAVNIATRRILAPLNHGGQLGSLFWYYDISMETMNSSIDTNHL